MAIEIHTTPRLAHGHGRTRVPAVSSREDLDWRGLARTWRRKLFLLGVVLLILGLTAAYVSRMPPAFEAEALVMLNERQAQLAPDIPELLSQLAPPNEQGLQSQLLLIRSRSMAERLVDELRLHMLPEFNPALRPRDGDITHWLDPAALIPDAILDYLPRAWADTLMTAASGVPMTDQRKASLLRSEIVENVMEHIEAEPANSTLVMSLRFVSTDPELAAIGANTLARLYLEEQLELKQAASRRAGEFLRQEIERLRESVSAAEQTIQEYRAREGLVEAQPVDEQQLSGLTTQLVLSRSQRAEAEARLRQVEQLLQSDTTLAAAAQLLESPVLGQLRTREIEINREIAELSSEYGARHPRMINLQVELSSLQDRKQTEIRQIAQGQRDEVQVLRSREAALQSNIERIRSQVAMRNEARVGLEALERDVQAERDLLKTYLNRAKEIGSQERRSSQMPESSRGRSCRTRPLIPGASSSSASPCSAPC